MANAARLQTVDENPNPYVNTLVYGVAFRPGTTVIYALQGNLGDTGLNGGALWAANGAAAAYASALASWAAVADIHFQAATQAYDGTGSRAGYDFVGQLTTTLPDDVLGQHTLPTTADMVGQFNSTISYFTTASNQAGGLSYLTFVHELGHGIGLLHPHADEPGDNYFPGVGDDAFSTGDFGLNQGIFTVMTYNDGYADVGISPSANFGWQTGPGAFDIAAVQYIYGANMTTALGATVYTLPMLNQAGTGWTAIWDAGGSDTLSAQGSQFDAILDLRPATLLNEEGGGGFVSRNAGVLGGFTIANGVVIENATGGNGNDTLIGNSANNNLNGGAGWDTLDLSHLTAGITVNLQTGTATGDGNDTLLSIENVVGGSGNDVLTAINGQQIANGTQLFFKTEGELNDSRASAYNLDGLFRGIMPNYSVSIRADGGGHQDYYSFRVANVSGPSTVTIDIDNSFRMDSIVELLDSQGNVLASNDDGAEGLDVGSANVYDSYLTFTLPQNPSTLTYYVRVSTYGGSSPAGVEHGSFYTLSVTANARSTASGNILMGSRLDGGAGDDHLNGSNGIDTLIGGLGNDVMNGGTGADLLYGGAGNDQYLVDTQGDLTFEGAFGDIDTVTASVGYYLYANIENLTIATGAGDIFGVGNDLDNVITGNAGSNLLLGGDGNDVVYGGAGIDNLFGEAGFDHLLGEAGIDYLVGGDGGGILDGGADADAIYGGDGRDTLIGGATFDTDILVGGAGDDILYANSGLGDYDLIDGGSGNDDYYVDTPDDLTFEAAGGGTDTVYADINGAGYYLYAHTENLVLLGDTPFGVGNELDNNLTGSGTGNYLLGGAGNDRLNGKGGNDVLFGEAGADIFVIEQVTGGDVIADFERGTDRIDLSDFEFANFAALQGRFSQVGADGAIDLGYGDFVVLHGVTMSELTASDFILTTVVGKSDAFGLHDKAGMIPDPGTAADFAFGSDSHHWIARVDPGDHYGFA